METSYRGNDLDEKTIKTVLIEYAEDQQKLISIVNWQGSSIKEMANRFVELEEKLSNQQKQLSQDNQPYKAFIQEELTGIKQAILGQDKPVVRQLRIQLFPEHNIMEYYRVVFGRLLGWLVLVLTATYLFSLGRQYIVHLQVIREKELETFHYRKAWNYLYQRQTKTERKKMDSAWQKSWQMPE